MVDAIQADLREKNITVFIEQHKLGPDEPDIILDKNGETIGLCDDLYSVVHFSHADWSTL